MVKVDFKPKAELVSDHACVWEVPSSSQSGIRHIVVIHVEHDGPKWFCSCKGFQFRADCKHLGAVQKWQEDYAAKGQ